MVEYAYQGRKIITNFDYPPIPSRNCDWSAVFDGYEGGDPIGRGATEKEAIADLIDKATADCIWKFCTTCDEEYLLPEDSDQCPICSNHTLEEV